MSHPFAPVKTVAQEVFNQFLVIFFANGLLQPGASLSILIGRLDFKKVADDLPNSSIC
jgi:hypothetical protein